MQKKKKKTNTVFFQIGLVFSEMDLTSGSECRTEEDSIKDKQFPMQ